MAVDCSVSVLEIFHVFESPNETGPGVMVLTLVRVWGAQAFL